MTPPWTNAFLSRGWAPGAHRRGPGWLCVVVRGAAGRFQRGRTVQQPCARPAAPRPAPPPTPRKGRLGAAQRVNQQPLSSQKIRESARSSSANFPKTAASGVLGRPAAAGWLRLPPTLTLQVRGPRPLPSSWRSPTCKMKRSGDLGSLWDIISCPRSRSPWSLTVESCDLPHSAGHTSGTTQQPGRAATRPMNPDPVFLSRKCSSSDSQNGVRDRTAT